MLTKLSALRVGLIAGGLALAALAVAFPPGGWSAARPGHVTLVYVGAADCPPCTAWQNTQEPAFRESEQFSHLTFRTVKAPLLLDVLKDEYWPEDLRPYRQTLGRGTGVPLWLVIGDGRLVLQSSGSTQWQEAVLPKLRALLR